MKRGRKAQACDNCAHKKVPCDKDMPCARCYAQQVVCSYRRANTGNDSAEVSFLLQYTDTSQENGSVGAIYKDTVESEVADDVVKSSDRRPFWEDDLALFDWNLWDLLPDYNLDQTYEIVGEQLPPSLTKPSNLDARVKGMIDLLSSTHIHMARCRIIEESAFELELARSVFTAENLLQFCEIHFKHYHIQGPLIHRPTFSLETASTPLLLAIFGAGSVYSPPVDHALSARRFLRVIEECIFSCTPFRRYLPQGQAFPDLEILQAALMIVVLQSSMNDAQTRRRIRVERMPELISTARSLDMMRAKHGTDGSNWQLFVDNEIRVRYALDRDP